MKFLEENLCINLPDLGLGNSFIDMLPKCQATKEKVDELQHS